MKSFLMIFREHYQNIYMINRLSLYELKNTYSGTFLGLIWVILNPMIQILVYWVVFGLGIRGGAPVDGVPYFVWLISGVVPWFFISSSITQGSNAIHARLGTISKMNFPLSIVPTFVVHAQLYHHVIILAVISLIFSLYIGFQTIDFPELLYFILAATCFLVALSFVTSTLSTLLRDIHLLIQSIVRMLFYLTPILWTPSEHLPMFFKVVFHLNPFYYVVEGYRAALLKTNAEAFFSFQTLYFWNFTIVLMLIGAAFHIKFRKQFVDHL
ncbi:teichoic acid transport system permease protein [Scopulibacillus darangshiensis]|uniref:Transport permease protein n=1 Tax=Scopulibacillus darangshiensis TaxID=442528 RepID=A0A4R2P755_9BACL|nr:ABC transporter permease [Scopulibacillus darangshiensis]TCP30004.1 teichoic acid transport system permease protein [Scopulibacillus darangshiensis]